MCVTRICELISCLRLRARLSFYGLVMSNAKCSQTDLHCLITFICFHLYSPPGSSDRLGRLAKHILTQQSYYPLYPPPESMPIDYEHFEHYAHMEVTPDVFISPSDLRWFIKVRKQEADAEVTQHFKIHLSTYDRSPCPPVKGTIPS